MKNTVEIQWKCIRNTREIKEIYSRNTVEIQWKCIRNTGEIREINRRNTVEMYNYFSKIEIEIKMQKVFLYKS